MFEDRTKRTELSSIGEFGLIDLINKNNPIQNESTLVGIGDDCAVLDSNNKKVLLSTDLLIENVHFDLSYTPLKHLGYKAAIVNFSDVAAMNALPTQITVSLGLSNRVSLEAVQELYAGIKLACAQYNVDLVGGDTTSSRKGLIISISVIGFANEDEIVYRSGAQKGDLVCVSGDLGGAYAALLILQKEKAAFVVNPEMQPELEGKEYILERHLKPEARVDVIKKLKEKGVKPTAMMDISDGLASEIKHICKASKTSCTIYEDKIPIDQQTWDTARSFDIDPTMCALNGGEDYELLMCIKQSDYEAVKDLKEIAIIGHITDASEGINLITKNGVSAPIQAQGWDALKKDTQ